MQQRRESGVWNQFHRGRDPTAPRPPPLRCCGGRNGAETGFARRVWGLSPPTAVAGVRRPAGPRRTEAPRRAGARRAGTTAGPRPTRPVGGWPPAPRAGGRRRPGRRRRRRAARRRRGRARPAAALVRAAANRGPAGRAVAATAVGGESTFTRHAQRVRAFSAATAQRRRRGGTIGRRSSRSGSSTSNRSVHQRAFSLRHDAANFNTAHFTYDPLGAELSLAFMAWRTTSCTQPNFDVIVGRGLPDTGLVAL
jgi:hypothetical protein